jgi:hypothetical protein
LKAQSKVDYENQGLQESAVLGTVTAEEDLPKHVVGHNKWAAIIWSHPLTPDIQARQLACS